MQDNILFDVESTVRARVVGIIRDRHNRSEKRIIKLVDIVYGEIQCQESKVCIYLLTVKISDFLNDRPAKKQSTDRYREQKKNVLSKVLLKESKARLITDHLLKSVDQRQYRRTVRRT